MADAALNILITAVDNASGSIDNIGKSVSNMGKIAAGVAVAGVAALGAAVVGVGKMAFDAANEYDAAMDALVISTGKSGAALDEMGESVQALFVGSGGRGGRGLEDIGKVMGEVAARTNLAGAPLQKFTDQLFKLSNLTGTEAATNIDGISKVLNQFGLAAEDGAEAMDLLFAGTQRTGLGFDELMAGVEKLAPVTQAFGFSLSETLGFMEKLADAGIDSALAATGLKTALGQLQEAGIEPNIGSLSALVAMIQGPDGLNVAMDYFGAKAGPAFYQAIQQGTIDAFGLASAMEETNGALDETTAATEGWQESWLTIQNTVTNALVPLGDVIKNFLDTYGKQFTDWFTKNVPGAISTAIAKLEEFIAFMQSEMAPGGEDSLIGPRGPSNATGMLMDFIRNNEYMSSPGNAGAKAFLLSALAQGQQNLMQIESGNTVTGPGGAFNWASGSPLGVVNPVNSQDVSMVRYDAQGNRTVTPVNIYNYGPLSTTDLQNQIDNAINGQGVR